jgi:hypothetical protein
MTIQRVVQPLSTPPRNKLKLFSGYKAAVIGSQDNMKAFRTHFESQEIQDILEHSKESLNTNPDLSASARVPRYGWKEKEIASLKAGRRKKVTAPVLPDATVVFDKEEIARAVDGWRKSNPLMSVETKDDNRDILVRMSSCHPLGSILTNGTGAVSSRRYQVQVPYHYQSRSKRR